MNDIILRPSQANPGDIRLYAIGSLPPVTVPPISSGGGIWRQRERLQRSRDKGKKRPRIVAADGEVQCVVQVIGRSGFLFRERAPARVEVIAPTFPPSALVETPAETEIAQRSAPRAQGPCDAPAVRRPHLTHRLKNSKLSRRRSEEERLLIMLSSLL